MIKKCKNCGRVLKRRGNETKAAFDKRIFCNRICSDKWFRKNGHPWRRAIVRRK